MFIDEVSFKVKGGNGGNGVVSFHREKYVDMGGPDGGDGGDGGDIILRVDKGLNTLADFRYQHLYQAEDGSNGGSQNQHGKNGEDLVLKVPPGTVVYDAESDRLIADLTEESDEHVVAHGGKGGKGNARFTKSTRKAPRFAEKGKSGEERTIRLELQLLADVGLIGYPNVGKSTLISAVSAAEPKIASYHFTTLQPNLGVVSYGDYKSFVMADIPGLIEGAHQGTGLGDEFLKHLKRTRLLVHVLDASGLEGREPLEDFQIINRELEEYEQGLVRLPQIVALNKIDLPQARDNVPDLKEKLEEKGYQVYPMSAVTGTGVQELVYAIGEKLEQLPDAKQPSEESPEEGVIIKPDFAEKDKIVIKKQGENRYRVTGYKVGEIVEKTNFDNDAALNRLLRVLKHHGLNEKLKESGVKQGDTVEIGPVEFEYVE